MQEMVSYYNTYRRASDQYNHFLSLIEDSCHDVALSSTTTPDMSKCGERVKSEKWLGGDVEMKGGG